MPKTCHMFNTARLSKARRFELLGATVCEPKNEHKPLFYNIYLHGLVMVLKACNLVRNDGPRHCRSVIMYGDKSSATLSIFEHFWQIFPNATRGVRRYSAWIIL